MKIKISAALLCAIFIGVVTALWSIPIWSGLLVLLGVLIIIFS